MALDQDLVLLQVVVDDVVTLANLQKIVQKNQPLLEKAKEKLVSEKLVLILVVIQIAFLLALRRAEENQA